MNNENMVEIKDLKKGFDQGKITALNGVDLTIKKGEFVSIIGPSGSGKSTLLNMIGALDKADEGSVSVAGYDLTKNKDLSEFRSKEIGFIFQLHNLIPNSISSRKRGDPHVRKGHVGPSYAQEGLETVRIHAPFR